LDRRIFKHEIYLEPEKHSSRTSQVGGLGSAEYANKLSLPINHRKSQVMIN
jgi:hypothetical protein